VSSRTRGADRGRRRRSVDAPRGEFNRQHSGAGAGIAERGELYEFSDRALGRIAGYDSVFAVGNVVTGKGNILASRKHSIEVTTQVIEQFIGIAPDGHDGEEVLLEAITSPVHDMVDNVISWSGAGRVSITRRSRASWRACARVTRWGTGAFVAGRRYAPKPS
jgi:hypothetical protein